MTLTPRWLRHIEDGSIYDWHPYLEKHPKLVEVSDEELFPEKYADPKVIAKMNEIKERHTEQLSLFTENPPEAPVGEPNPELNDEITVRTRKRAK